MNQHPEKTQYLDLIQYILDNGHERMDRTGTGTLSCFGLRQEFDMSDGFPLLTTKKMSFKSICSELLWFLEGSGDERRLAEILYGKPAEELVGKRTIWTPNAESDYWKPKAKFDGDLGNVYGVQWRQWENTKGEVFDQIANLIKGIVTDPYGRRHLVSAWNPGELDRMALPPCHYAMQFYVGSIRDPDGYEHDLDCMVQIRSNDIGIGNPYNVASYALLLHMVAAATGTRPGRLIISIGDAHIYLNQLDQLREQLTREPRSFPSLVYNGEKIHDLFGHEMGDWDVANYDPHPAIRMEMAV